MNRVLLSFLFVVTLLISVMAHLPAHVGLGFILPLPGIKLDGLSGTVWNGSAASFHVQDQSIGSLDWEVNFLRLFLGKADLTVRLSGVSGLSADGHIGYGLSGAYANDLRLSLSANMISDYLPVPIPVSLSGKVKVVVNEYLVNNPLCNTLNGTLTWSQAQVISPIGTAELGPVTANLSCKSGNIVMKGKSNSDAIETEFNVSLAPNQQIEVDGLLKPGEALPESLKSQLKWLGEPDSEGRYQLNFNG